MFRKFFRTLGLTAALMMVLSLGLISASAQDDLPGPGQGGAVIRGNTRGSANLGSLLPLRCNGVDCADPGVLMWPVLVTLDPVTQNYSPDLLGQGQLANGWTISNNDLTYTFTLREEAYWNDGTPITALDVYFGWDAMRQGDAVGMAAGFSQAAQELVSAELIDDYTISFTIVQASCNALQRIASIPVMPSHVFGYAGPNTGYDWNQLVDLAQSTYDTAPEVTSGPFNFFRTEPGTAVFLSANTDYWDNNGPYTVPEGWVYIDTPDETVMVERFLTFTPGDINLVFEPTANFGTLRDSAAQFFESPGRVWHYLVFNTADPNNPQNGVADPLRPPGPDNPYLEQGHHPLFSDVRVRQALQHATDINEVIEGALNGEATPMVTATIPTAYTIHPTLERRPYDLDAARALLDAAGFVSTGAPLVAGGDGLRTCQGCLYAVEGTPLSFTLNNPGGPRNDVSVILQALWAQIGVEVEVQPLDFNTMYNLQLGAQVFDAAVAGWRGGLPFDADQRSFFGAQNDVVDDQGANGSNTSSWTNPRFEELGSMVNTVPGCDLQTRLEIAWEMQEILWEEQPYLYLYTLNNVYAAAPNVQGFAPYPLFGTWNVDAWNVTQ